MIAKGFCLLFTVIGLTAANPFGINREDEVVVAKPAPRDAALVAKGKSDKTTVAEVSITFWYTDRALKKWPNMQRFTKRFVDESNRMFTEEKIPLAFKVHCLAQTVAEVDGNTDTNTDYVNESPADFKRILNGADVGFTIRSMSFDEGEGGTAYYDDPSRPFGRAIIGVEDESEYAEYSDNITEGARLILHEIGHIMGGNHFKNPELPDTYPYAHPFVVKGTTPKLTTIMASAPKEGTKGTTHFSSSVAKFKGQPLGDATHDNARILTENRFSQAAIGDEKAACVPLDGVWSSWSKWRCNVCNKDNNGGYVARHRSCSNPAPLNGGKYCAGKNFESKRDASKTCYDADKCSNERLDKYPNCKQAIETLDPLCISHFWSISCPTTCMTYGETEMVAGHLAMYDDFPF